MNETALAAIIDSLPAGHRFGTEQEPFVVKTAGDGGSCAFCLCTDGRLRSSVLIARRLLGEGTDLREALGIEEGGPAQPAPVVEASGPSRLLLELESYVAKLATARVDLVTELAEIDEQLIKAVAELTSARISAEMVSA